MGFVLLEGGSEFRPGMAAADGRALAAGGGRTVPVRIIPAAAAPDHNDRQAGAHGVAWFHGLGAIDVRALPIIDRASADRAELALELEGARLIFLLGGSPRYLAETLAGTRTWDAMKRAHRAGGVIGGSSAGAMVLCEHYFDPPSGQVLSGLNLLTGPCLLPHHDTFGKTWAALIARLQPGAPLIGIDEETALLNDGPAGRWTVYGKGAVTVYESGGQTVFRHGDRLTPPIPARNHPATPK